MLTVHGERVGSAIPGCADRESMKQGDGSKTAPLLAVVLLVMAGGFGWSSYTQWRHEAQVARLQHLRDLAVSEISKAISAHKRRLDAMLQHEVVASALASGNAAAAVKAIDERFEGAEKIELFPADLTAAYAQAAKFGYARLGLLESALSASTAQARVVRDPAHPSLGVAAAVELGDLTAVVYVRLPLRDLTAALDAAVLPGNSYLALRQGNYAVIEKGEIALSGQAELLARPLEHTGLRMAAGIADVQIGPLGMHAGSCLLVAVLMLVTSGLVMLTARGRLPSIAARKAADTDAGGPTLRETLQLEYVQESGTDAEIVIAVDTAPPPASPVINLDAGIFGSYDIRGVVGQQLDPPAAMLIGQAVGTRLQAQDLQQVVVGYDGRVSSPELAAALIEGLRSAGCDVMDVGRVPTPMVYFAGHHLHISNCIAVTASDASSEYNGFKIVIEWEALDDQAVSELYQSIAEERLHTATEPGRLLQRDIVADYIQRIAGDIQLDRPLKVVVDAGNGVAGEDAPRMLEAIGAEVIRLHCDVDGRFPNHQPDPNAPDNLQDLVQTVKRFEADLGLALDGDAVRLAVVTSEGESIDASRILMLFAADVLQRNPGALILHDVSFSGKLPGFVVRHGGSSMMCKTGHSPIKAKMRETGAELAGEMSGHFFFRERWYGFEDGMYAAARLLEILGQSESIPSEILHELPCSLSTSEIEVPLNIAAGALIDRLVDAMQTGQVAFEGARICTIDGLRADFSDGWGLLRSASNVPMLVLRFEAESQQALQRIRAMFRERLQSLLPEQTLKF